MKDFFRRYYTPNNLSLVIAGDFDPAQAKTLVEKYFGSIQPGPALDRPARWVPTLNAERIVEVADRVPQERTYMVWPAPEYFAPDDAALNLASRILTDGLSSRLNKALVYDKPLCTAVSSFPLGAEIAGAIVVQATARPGVVARRGRADRHRADCAAGEDGPDAGRARSRAHEAGVRVRLRAGAHRRVRRQGGSAESVQRVPRRSREVRGRHGALPQAVGRRRPRRRRSLAEHAQPAAHPLPSRDLGRPAESTLDRSKQPAFGEDRPFRRRRCRRQSWTTGSSSSSSSDRICRRSRLPSRRARARLPIPPARTGSRR